MLEEDKPSVFGLHIDEATKENLRTMASWALIVAATMVIRYVISIIEFFNTRRRLQSMADEYGYEYEYDTSDSGLIWTLLGIAIGLIVCYFLYRFSTLTKKGLESNSQEDFDNGILNLRNYFLTVAIVLIVGIAIAIIAFTLLGAGPI